MTRLTWDDIARTAKPSVDRHSVLFEHDGRLLRGFRGDALRSVRMLLEPRVAEDAVRAGLVPFHRRTDVDLAGYPLVVEVERLSRISYPPEWTTRGLLASAHAIVALQRTLLPHGLMLKDAHPWNVLFQGRQPRFIDLGSVVGRTRRVPRPWFEEFRRHLVVPLSLRRIGAHAAADAVQGEHFGVLKRLLSRRFATPFPAGFWFAVRGASSEERRLERLARYLDGLGSHSRRDTWTDYDQHEVPVGQESAYNGKQSAVLAFLREEPRGSLLDLAANRGWFTALASSLGHQVVAIDVDDGALAALWDRCESSGIEAHIIRADVVRPPGSHGVALVYDGFFRRMRSDVLLAPAVLHHLVARQDVTFELFADLADRLADRTVVVEFVPREDEHVARWPLAQEDWYEPASFERAMRAYFPRMDVVASSPAPRLMYRFRR